MSMSLPAAGPVHGQAGDVGPARAQPWWRQLWPWVMLAMVAGVALGYAAPEAGTAMQPLGDAFIRLIRMLIAPIIFCTVVHGVASMGDMAKVGRVALKALIYFEVVTTVALVFGLVMVNLTHPGTGMNVDASTLNTAALGNITRQTHEAGVIPFLMNIIPNTLIGAFAEGNVLQVLLISLIAGFALSWMGPAGQPLVQLVGTVSQMLFRGVAIVMWAAPIGAFGAIAFTVGRFGATSLWSLLALLGWFYVTCILFVVVVFGAISVFCGFSLFRLIRYIREELLIVFATTSSETVLPRLIAKMEALGCEEGVVGLVVPTGYSFNLDGTCLYLAFAAVFLAQATNTPLGIEQQVGLLAVLLLASKGAAGVAGAAFVVLAATLSSVGTIPVAAVGLVLGIHRLMSEGLTPTNLVGNAVATIVVAKWEGSLDEARMRRVLAGEAPAH
ncbi:C4-dicarboxylate transporter DctA [Roseomonas elaeocarpi]|uniref:C4-dicarboxylate transporter DctA n=1 Tax=Roseomonas elaeocarpi TaxID=907779 RepID=A0ABV6JPD4_9PROT